MSFWTNSFTPGTERADALAWAGQKITIGASAVTVTHLGRWVIPGSSGTTHTVKLVTAATGVDVSGGSVSINTTGAPVSAFKYTALSSPITLTAGASYYLVSNEPGGTEHWLDYTSTQSVTGVASQAGTVYNLSSTGGTWAVNAVPGYNYVGTDFQYSAGIDTTAPVVVSRVVNGATLTITYDDTLDPAYVPAISAYTVLVNSVARTVTNVTVSGATIVLTLSTPVLTGQTVTLSYVP